MLLVGLVLADGLITQFLIVSGIAIEGNPFLRNLFTTGDFMSTKIAGSLLSALLLTGINRRRPKMAMVTSWCFIAVYTGIVYWNIAVIVLGFKF